jgi:hypothetical protein
MADGLTGFVDGWDDQRLKGNKVLGPKYTQKL